MVGTKDWDSVSSTSLLQVVHIVEKNSYLSAISQKANDKLAIKLNNSVYSWRTENSICSIFNNKTNQPYHGSISRFSQTNAGEWIPSSGAWSSKLNSEWDVRSTCVQRDGVGCFL